MIGTIRKHSKVLWIIIIAATVVAFVIFFSPYQPVSGGGGPANFGRINGQRVTKEDFFNAQREVLLRYYFSYADWPGPEARRMGFDLDRETYFRLLLIQKARQMGIHVSTEAVARVAAELLRSFNRGNPVPLAAFERQVLAGRGLTTADFERFVRNDLGIQQVMAAAGASGRLVTPDEARRIYEREHTELAVEAVFFSGSNHLAEVTVTPEAVAQFYTNQMAAYRLPDRVQVKYVAFSVSNHLVAAEQKFAELTNLNEIVEATYRQLGTNFFREAKSVEEGREKAREWMIRTNALTRAFAEAGEFARIVFDREPARAENLATVAAEKGLTVRVSEPFDRDYGPDDLAVRPDFAKRAFALSADEPMDGPLVGDHAVYIIALDKKLPSEIPALEKIRDRVTADYQFSEAVKVAARAGEAFAAALTNGMAVGKNFSAVCGEQRVKAQSLPPFSLSTRELPELADSVNLNELKRAAFTTPPGRASGFIPTREGGFAVFVREKLPLDPARVTADLPAFIGAVRQARVNEVFSDWFRKEAERGLRQTPIFQPQQPQLSGVAGN